MDENRSIGVGTVRRRGATGVSAGIEVSTPMGPRSRARPSAATRHRRRSTAGALTEGADPHGAVSGTGPSCAGNRATAPWPAATTVTANGGGGSLEAPSGLFVVRTRMTGSVVTADKTGVAPKIGLPRSSGIERKP